MIDYAHKERMALIAGTIVGVHSSQHPDVSLLQGRPYVNSQCTDVRETWKRHGWEPTQRPQVAS